MKLNTKGYSMLLDTKNTLFVCIDIQERLLPLMAHKDEVIKNANLLLQVAEILGAQSLVSEQYTKGLGKTCEQIKIPQNAKVLEKTSFGIFNDEGIKEFIKQSGCKTLVIFGIEAHICVLQSIVDALALGYECVLAADGVSSRNATHQIYSLDFFRSLQNGSSKSISVLPSESIVFALLKDSKHANFKEISALIK